MKLKMIALLALAFVVTGCSFASPDAGYEGVKIRKPFFFGHGGVVSVPVQPGRQFIALTTDVVYVPTTPIQYNESFDDLMSKDGVPLDFDAVLRLQITDTVRLIREFGPIWYAANVKAEFTNRVRQAVRKYGMNETALDTSAIDAIDTEVSQGMETYITDANLPLRLVQVTVGRANPPDAVKDQRIATATQEQRANTERQTKIAEDQRREAEAARATADNAYRNALGLDTRQFIQLQQIGMLRDVCSGGKCTLLVGASGVVPTLGVN